MRHRFHQTAVAATFLLLTVVLPHAAVFGQDRAPPGTAPRPQPRVNRGIVMAAAPAIDKLKDLGKLLKSALDLTVELLSGNEAHLLSGNATDLLSKNKTELLSGNRPKLLSGNQTPIMSGNRISVLSNNKLEIHIINSGNNNGNPGLPPPSPPRAVPTVRPDPAQPPAR